MKFSCLKKGIFIFIFLVSCNYQMNTNYDIVLDKYPNTRKYNIYLILPKEPCGSCTSISYEFVKKIDSLEYNKLRIFFLNKSINEIENRITENILASNDVVINPSFMNDTLISIVYPTILYLKNNTIKKVEEQNAKNPFALEKLELIINSELHENE